MNTGLILLILIGILNIAALALLSVRHWRKPETERILPMRAGTRKFIGRVIALMTAEMIAVVLIVSALTCALASDLTVMLGDTDRLTKHLKTVYDYYQSFPEQEDYMTANSFSSLFLNRDGFNPFWSAEIQFALFKQADKTRVADHYPGNFMYGSKYPVVLFGNNHMWVETGYPLSYEKAIAVPDPPESRPMPSALAGLLHFLYPKTKNDTLCFPAGNSVFDGSFRYAQKILLIPTDNEKTEILRLKHIIPAVNYSRYYLHDDIPATDIEKRARYGITPEKIEEMEMTPFFEFVALGNAEVDALVAENPALADNVYIFYAEGSVTSLFKLFFQNNRTMTADVFSAVLIFYLLAAVIFIIANKRQTGKRERLLLQRERDLMRDVAHELKTPLGVTRLLAEKVQLENDPLEKDRAAEQLTGKVDAMNAVVMKNLNASRLENTDEPMHREEFSLRDMVLALAEDNAVLTEEKGQKLRLQGMEEDIKISADPVRMEEAITNLLSNAVKYAPSGSEITLSLRETKRKAVLGIRNGCEAIPAKELRTLWEPYTRLQRDKDSDVQGTGLGLAVVRNIVTLHGGRYGAKNVSGGVEFWVEVPTV
ncbi:MAG: HAMP domain-containing histidine kinase [Oscillospiraceae bacterium]|nr:HAMP domain-containing histidine kinase [Oscillospiraceae bacterium]